MNPSQEINVALDDLRDKLSQTPEGAQHIQEVVDEILSEAVPIELLEELIFTLYGSLQDPSTYPKVRAELIQSGVADEEDLPDEFDPRFVMLLLCSLDLVRDQLTNQASPQAFARGGLASLGRNGDTMVAHINPIEARMLLRNGGAGTINPVTGLPEFGFFKKIKKVFKKIVKPLLAVASIVPGPWQPFALAANAVYNASQGNWLGAALSGFGAYAAPGGFGGFGSAGSGAAGMGGSLGSGITGGMDASTFFGGIGDGASSLAGAGGAGAAGMGSSLGNGIAGGLSNASSAAGSLAGAASGAAEGLGGLSLGGLGESAGGLSFGGLGEATVPAMENLGGLGDGVSGSIPTEAGNNLMDTLNTAKKVVGIGKTAYNLLNPPEPEQYSQQNTQRQMQQLGGMQGPGMNTSRAFGLGGTQSRGMGMMSRFRNGGLARCTCGGK